MKTVSHIKNYRSGVILLLTAVVINLGAGIFNSLELFDPSDLMFYIAFAG